MPRNTSRDGLKNRLESLLLTKFAPVWRLLQAIPFVRSALNRSLIRRAILKTKTRPHAFSLLADYTSWESLTNRRFTGRHLPAASPETIASLPDVQQVTRLFEHTPATYRLSHKSTVLFTSFAQWFTDGFLRTDRNDWRKNTSNHEIDLCQIYGLNPQQTAQLRAVQGGKLKTSIIGGCHYPPLYFDDHGQPKAEFDAVQPRIPPNLPPERKEYIFVGGVERLNVSIGYAMLNTLFLREHNRLCDKLAEAYPDWDSERLFQTARNILIAILLRIVIEDYINHITPYHFKFLAQPWSFKRESWYRNNWMTLEFNLLYRWHSMIPNTILVDGVHQPISHALFNNKLLIDRGLGTMFEDASRQKTAELGLLNTAAELLETEQRALQLGRDARLRSYNDYRELFQFPRVTDWSQISGRPEVCDALRATYRDVDQIEFFAGLFAEDVRENSALSPLIGRMVGVDAFSQALTNPLLSVHVFNPQTFSEVGWNIIHETNSLSQLLHRNLTGDDARCYAVRFTQDGDEIPEPPQPPESTEQMPLEQTQAVSDEPQSTSRAQSACRSDRHAKQISRSLPSRRSLQNQVIVIGFVPKGV